MTLKLYNTLSGQKEDFQPYDPTNVSMYVCGVTVYNSSHIGHAMSAVVFDIIRRYLEYRGYPVQYVQNFTDIDDKIIIRAAETGQPWQAITEKYVQEYLEGMDALNVKRATAYPRATVEIGGIIAAIQTLIDKGFAYPANGDVYFRVLCKPEYGELKHQSVDELQIGARIDIDENKENALDFALWKAAKPGEPGWTSPWGEGRPGWHIECSAMALHHLGEQLDIHGGGTDLIFPHHENEIAQSESLTGHRPFVKYWMHNGLLQFGTKEGGKVEKMSKSLGNTLGIANILQRGDADTLRFFVMNSHYRNPLTYSEESFEAAKRGLERMKSVFSKNEKWGESSDSTGKLEATAALQTALDANKAAFFEAMDDDFNTPNAVARMFDLVREIYKGRDNGASPAVIASARATLLELGNILGLRLDQDLSPQREDAGAEPFIQALVDLRSELKAAKQYALADSVRNKLKELGVKLEDRPDGTIWKYEG